MSAQSTGADDPHLDPAQVQVAERHAKLWCLVKKALMSTVQLRHVLTPVHKIWSGEWPPALPWERWFSLCHEVGQARARIRELQSTKTELEAESEKLKSLCREIEEKLAETEGRLRGQTEETTELLGFMKKMKKIQREKDSAQS